jgi:hypothetical protein
MTTRGRSKALAGYVKYAPGDKRAVAPRGEYFDDNQGWTTGTDRSSVNSPLLCQVPE